METDARPADQRKSAARGTLRVPESCSSIRDIRRGDSPCGVVAERAVRLM